jgi:hypothetical protein
MIARAPANARQVRAVDGADVALGKQLREAHHRHVWQVDFEQLAYEPPNIRLREDYQRSPTTS